MPPNNPHFGTTYLERAAAALQDKLRGNIDSFHLPEKIEGQHWVRQGEELGQGLKDQVNLLLHDASARIDWTDLKSITNSLSSVRQGQQQNLDRVLSSLSATSGKHHINVSAKPVEKQSLKEYPLAAHISQRLWINLISSRRESVQLSWPCLCFCRAI